MWEDFEVEVYEDLILFLAPILVWFLIKVL